MDLYIHLIMEFYGGFQTSFFLVIYVIATATL